MVTVLGWVFVGIAWLIAALMFIAFLGMFASDEVKYDEELEKRYLQFEEEWYEGLVGK